MLKILLGLVVTYVFAAAFIYFSQSTLIFPASVVDRHNPSERIEPLEMKMSDGTILKGAISRAQKEEGATVLLHFGGNAQDVRFIVDVFSLHFPEYRHIGLNYRGYVESQGKPSEKDIFADSIYIYDQVVEQFKPNQILAHGYSLGSGVTSYLSAHRKLKGMLLTVPYDSITAVGQSRYPWLPVEKLIQHRFDSVKNLQENKTPLAIFSVKGDRVVPNEHTNRLKDHASPLVFEYEFLGIQHGDVLTHIEFKEVFSQAILKFVD